MTKWSGDTIKLPAIPRKILKNGVLTGGTAQVQQSESGISIAVPQADRQKIDTIISLELDGPAATIKPLSMPAQ